MTNSSAAEARPAHPAGRPCGAVQGQDWFLVTGSESLVNTIASLNSVPTTDAPQVAQPSSSSGSVAGTVLRAARLSAGLTQSQLAAAVDADERAVTAWEDGAGPLASLPYTLIQRLEGTLVAAGADPALARDLTAATWCDLVIEAITDSEDIRCLMSDPIAAEEAFAELVAWSISGHRPARYRPYAGPGPLLRNDCAFAAIAIQHLGATMPVPSPQAA
jgi:transcriptional regulator with XRE-family HTH domain